MPNKVCILAKSRREAMDWAKANGISSRHVVAAPYSPDRVVGVHFSKIVTLPSFESRRNRHAIVKALKNTESRRFVKNKPEWVTVDDEGGMPPPNEGPVTITNPFANAPEGSSIAFKLPEHAAKLNTKPKPKPQAKKKRQELPGQIAIDDYDELSKLLED